ncbi:MAG: TerC family protein [Bdellovibrionota bacterium]
MDLLTFDNLAALVALTSLEIVLGIDNIVFLTILVDRLPKAKQATARFIGLSLAMIFRILLLLFIKWIMLLTQPLFSVAGIEFSGKSLILFGGGLFLLWKATIETHKNLEGEHDAPAVHTNAANLWGVILQIILIDLVFSLDSVITAVGMVESITIMITAIVIAIIVMMAFAGYISRTIEKHPTLKMLALAFLMLVGVLLVAEGLGKHMERGYLYFAMGFSLFVEVMNIRIRTKKKANTH